MVCLYIVNVHSFHRKCVCCWNFAYDGCTGEKPRMYMLQARKSLEILLFRKRWNMKEKFTLSLYCMEVKLSFLISCINLTSVVIPNTVKMITGSAFSY